jgi:hypothetical protein
MFNLPPFDFDNHFVPSIPSKCIRNLKKKKVSFKENITNKNISVRTYQYFNECITSNNSCKNGYDAQTIIKIHNDNQLHKRTCIDKTCSLEFCKKYKKRANEQLLDILYKNDCENEKEEMNVAYALLNL